MCNNIDVEKIPEETAKRKREAQGGMKARQTAYRCGLPCAIGAIMSRVNSPYDIIYRFVERSHSIPIYELLKGLLEPGV